MTTASPRSWLRPFLASLAPTFREVLLISLFINLAALAVPVFVLQVYDRVVFHAGLSTLQGLVLGMIIVLVFDYTLRQGRARIMQTVAARADVAVGRRLFDKLTALPLRVLEGQPTAAWQMLFRDADVVRNTVSGASAILVADLPFVILFLGLAFVIAPPVAWILLLALPLFVLVAWRSGTVMATANRSERDATLGRDRLLAEMIAGRTTVKALALDRAIRPVWEDRHADTIERAIDRGARMDGYTNLGTTLTMVTTVTLTAVGAIAIINHQMTIGALIAVNILAGRLVGPLTQLVGMWRSYAAFGDAVDRLGRTFAMPSDRQDSSIALARPTGRIGLETVRYRYSPEARPAIDGVTLTIGPHGVTALVGPNGSGKTTLLKLIQGLYPPDQGRVLLDGADIAQLSRSELAAWIGYVPQECVLFAGSLKDNIAHRCPGIADADVIAAAEAADAHGFIIDLPDGYGTDVGEAGMRLSAGQRQRIAIARALLGDPPVLVLDEPSSNLDRQAEYELRRTLVRLGQSRTVVIVTHSPILLSACSSLVALDGGKVAAAGPAAEILPRLFGVGRDGRRDDALPPSARPVAAATGNAASAHTPTAESAP
ncbi:MAG: ATP-binding cassette domain-containing protein [Rhodospirillales bacterium]|nr:MAG: ATP-binding cassette domain-containing protein [Rhodospirillales bacterium]